jgi:hypothetical protein
MLREEFEALAGGHHHRGFSLVDEEPGRGAKEVEGVVMKPTNRPGGMYSAAFRALSEWITYVLYANNLWPGVYNQRHKGCSYRKR